MQPDSAGSARESGGRNRKRPWLAALLSVVYPGLGHVYLRLWGRALLWFGSIVAATALLIPPAAYPETVSAEAMLGAAEAMPLEVSVVIFVMAALNVADAYLMGRRVGTGTDGDGGGGLSCPNCGKEVDADLDFCQWCTEKL